MSIYKKKQQASGFTLIELMVTLAVLGVLVALAVPSFEALLQKQRVKNASETIFNFVKLARSEAIKQNTNVAFHFDNNNACYAIDDDSSTACDCSTNPLPNPPVCTLDEQQKIGNSSDFKEVTINLKSSDSLANSITRTFKPDGLPLSTIKSELIFEVDSRIYNLEINEVGRIKLNKEP